MILLARSPWCCTSCLGTQGGPKKRVQSKLSFVRLLGIAWKIKEAFPPLTGALPLCKQAMQSENSQCMRPSQVRDHQTLYALGNTNCAAQLLISL